MNAVVISEKVREAFYSKVVSFPGLHSCWNWSGSKFEGYGQLWDGKRPRGAHVISYLIHIGDIPDGAQVNHDETVCHSRSCCNPMHLYLGTQKENMQDLIATGNHPQLRKTTCPNGHEYDLVKVNRAGRGRWCRVCWNTYMREYNRKRKL